MNILFKSPDGETVVVENIDSDKVEITMERFLKAYQQEGLHIRKVAPSLFDISRRDSYDTLHRLGSLVVE